ncbi:hypothetical protein D9M71_249360 [compost metagenome]
MACNAAHQCIFNARARLGQAEGLTRDDAGNLQVVSGPNLFCRFRRYWPATQRPPPAARVDRAPGGSRPG